jgi:hypothetical protein
MYSNYQCETIIVVINLYSVVPELKLFNSEHKSISDYFRITFII